MTKGQLVKIDSERFGSTYGVVVEVLNEWTYKVNFLFNGEEALVKFCFSELTLVDTSEKYYHGASNEVAKAIKTIFKERKEDAYNKLSCILNHLFSCMSVDITLSYFDDCIHILIKNSRYQLSTCLGATRKPRKTPLNVIQYNEVVLR